MPKRKRKKNSGAPKPRVTQGEPKPKAAQGAPATLSQCMIVKNEEENIEKALSWGKGIVCEQIVVDTGSTDCTIGLAEHLGAKVYHFERINDFAAARNFAIEHAKGDWIVVLDADEYFPEEEAKNILPLLGLIMDDPDRCRTVKPCDARYFSSMTMGSQRKQWFRNAYSKTCPSSDMRGKSTKASP